MLIMIDAMETSESSYRIRTKAPGPAGNLPLTDDMLRNWSSGDLFGLSQDAGMGWNPAMLGRHEFLIPSTSGGIRADDGSPIALGYHTGHWEVGLLMQAAAREFKAALLLNPVNRAEAHTDLAESYFKIGKKDDAKKQTLSALEIAPTYPRAQDLLLKILEGRP
jgi:hypothetical protein